MMFCTRNWRSNQLLHRVMPEPMRIGRAALHVLNP